MNPNSNSNPSPSKFSFFQYTSSTLIHNTLIFELEKLQKLQQDIYNEFPFHRQMCYIAQINSITTTNVTFDEVAQYYLTRKIKLPKELANKSAQWNKITVEYVFQNNLKQTLLSSFPWIQKSEILKATSSEILPKHFQLLDGIYSLRDLNSISYPQSPSPLQISKENEIPYKKQPSNEQIYIEKMFEFTNKRIIFQFVYSQLLRCLSKLAQKNINIDYSLDNLILLLEGQNPKFIFLPIFTGFAEQLQVNYLEDSATFNYEAFRKQYYLDEQGKLNQFFRDKNLKFINDLQSIFLTDEEKKDIERESSLLKDTLLGIKSIEEIVLYQDLKKRFTKEFIFNNQILNLLMNNQDIKEEFKRTYILEGKLLMKQINEKHRNNPDQMSQYFSDNDEFDNQMADNLNPDESESQHLLDSLTESEILDDFLQKCLAITKNNLSNSQNSFVFTCEELVEKSKSTSSNSSSSSSSQQQSSQKQSQQNLDANIKSTSNISIKSDKSNSSSLNHSMQSQQGLPNLTEKTSSKSEQVKSLFDSKRKLQIILRILEVLPVTTPIQTNPRQQNTEQKPIMKTNNNSMIQNPQQQLTQPLDNSHKQPHQDTSQLNNWTIAPNLRVADKKLMIDFSESDQRLTIKFLPLPIEIFINPDNTDSIVYVFQILNLEFSQFSIYFDEFRQVIIEGQVFTGGNDQRVLMQMIYMIDMLVSYGIIFCEFYFNYIQIAKPTRDTSKYSLLVNEIQEMIQQYNLKFEKFISENNLDKRNRVENSKNK